VADLDRWSRSTRRGTGQSARRKKERVEEALTVRDLAKAQSQAAADVRPVDVQLALDLGDAPNETTVSGLPELTVAEQTRAELEVLGLDASRHVLACYEPFFAAVGVTRAKDLMRCRSREEVLVAGVKVATQTPPIR